MRGWVDLTPLNAINGVMMQAPNGQQQRVPQEHVQHFVGQGAQLV